MHVCECVCVCVCAHVYDCIMEVGHSGGGSRLVTIFAHFILCTVCCMITRRCNWKIAAEVGTDRKQHIVGVIRKPKLERTQSG